MNADRDFGLAVRRIGIDTHQEFEVYMRRDCHVYRAEGFEAPARVLVRHRDHTIIATLNAVDPPLLALGEAGLSNSAWQALGASTGDRVTVAHAPALDSMSQVRAKIYGHRLDAPALGSIVDDVAAGHYPDTFIAAFLAACAGGRMDLQETCRPDAGDGGRG
jgi:thymidine phosphorylase